MSVLAIIPARSGSKGIPNKNWKLLAGVSPTQRAYEVALACGCDPIVLSTDVVFVDAYPIPPAVFVPRPDALAQDDTSMLDVVRHVLAQIPGPPDQAIVLLQPTQPLREPKHITQALALLTRNVTSVVSVVELPRTHGIEMQLSIEQERLHPARWWCECGHERLSDLPPQRQAVTPTYIRDGTVYAFWRDTLNEARGRFGIYGHAAKPLIIPPDETCPLDSPADWLEAERRLRERD